MYRLTQEARTAPTGTTFTDDYVYDLVGNRVTKSSTGGLNPNSTAYTYNANDQLLQEVFTGGSGSSQTAYQYDANGSQISKVVASAVPAENSSYTFTYNLENRLTTATISRTEDGTPVSLSTAYLYNRQGIRVRADATRTIGGTTSTETKLFLNDPNNHTGYSQVLEELNDNGSAVSVARSYTIGDDVLAQQTGFTTQFLAYDGHGSTRLLTGSGGNIASRFSYDAYGRTLNSELLPAEAGGILNPSATSLLYAGEQFDSDLSQYYLRARYYDPANGRFNRLDPFAGDNFDPQSLHKYAYAHQDPVNKVDPSGQFTLIELVVVISIIALLTVLLLTTGCDGCKKTTPVGVTTDEYTKLKNAVDFMKTLRNGRYKLFADRANDMLKRGKLRPQIQEHWGKTLGGIYPALVTTLKKEAVADFTKELLAALILHEVVHTFQPGTFAGESFRAGEHGEAEAYVLESIFLNDAFDNLNLPKSTGTDVAGRYVQKDLTPVYGMGTTATLWLHNEADAYDEFEIDNAAIVKDPGFL